MSIDRRIVSILYHNNITDVNLVEEFIGENNGYYEVKIDGEIKKLKIPDKNYFELADEIRKINNSTEEEKQELIKKQEESIQRKKEDISELLKSIKDANDEPYFNKDFIDKNILKLPVDIDESLNLVVEQSKANIDFVETNTTIIVKNIDDEEKLIEKKNVIDEEDKSIVKKKKSIFKKTNKKPLDNDSEFITSI